MAVQGGTLNEVAYEPDVRLQTRRITPEVLAYLVDKIVRAVGPRQVIVFGSQARGTAGEASDLDLLSPFGRVKTLAFRRQLQRGLW